MASSIQGVTRSRHQRRHHRGAGADPAPDGFRLVKDAKGELIPPHFIQQLKFEYNGKDVFVADWGTAVSKDPYVKFSFKGAKKGDDLKVTWTDNKGGSDTTTAKIS